jgi:hypothetical protein
VPLSIDQAREILCHDLDADFVEAITQTIAWEYSQLYEALAADDTLVDEYRDEEFRKRRGDCAVRSLTRCAKRYGVPFEFLRLECNGQRKLLVKASRLIILPECMLTLEDRPSIADYKQELADIHGFVRQLELDLGDQPKRIRDWSGCILAVLLHGPAGRRFVRQDRSLGSIMLAVPDAAYRHWILRLDLHGIAMHGRRGAVSEGKATETAAVQADDVIVTSKARESRSGAA